MANFGFVLYLAIAGASTGSQNSHLLYLSLLFAICSTPLLFLRKLNDRYSLCTIFLTIYFVSFGVLDLAALSSGAGGGPVTADLLSKAELVILAGGLAFVAGYYALARQPSTSAFAVTDWPKLNILAVGLLLWAAGTVATWYWSVDLTVRSGQFNFNAGQPVLTTLMLGRYAQPLGLLMLAYCYTAYRSVMLTLLVVAIACLQVYIGFVSDTKGGAMSAGIMVIVTAFLVTGRIPKAWAIAAGLFIVLAFPVFQAHRTIVVNEHQQSNAQSVQNFGKALDLSLQGQQRVATEHAQSFFQRSSVKGAVEMIVRKTGTEVPYQNGYTLLPLLTVFIPRFIWPEKLDIQTGQLVDKVFHVTGLGEVYISPSQLGELYWNFGWIGATGGMLLIGMLLGWINRECDLTRATSVTRLLILAITAYQFGVRFEGAIAGEYSTWIRSVVGILLMHWFFSARNPAQQLAQGLSTAVDLKKPSPVPFPNLLR